MRGFFFSMDAMFALLIVIATIPILTLLSLSAVSPEVIHERLHLQAEDAINVMSEIRVIDVIREPVILNYYGDVLDGDDVNKTLIDVLGMLWSSDNISYTEAARNITEHLFSRIMPSNTKWSLSIENDTIYNTTGDITRTISISKKIASGFMKEQPSTGYIAKVYLNRINGKRTASYIFFGGFVGEGKISKIVSDIPENTTIREIYMEMNVGNNFTLYINDNPCNNFTKSPGEFSVDNWTITDSTCLSYLNPGENNTILIDFISDDLTTKYIGGGYIKIVYDTTELVRGDNGRMNYTMPGIDGIINLYSSFYVPGTLDAVNAYLHYFNNVSNITVFFNIGNITVYESNVTGENNINLNNSYIESKLALLGYDFLSNKTIPIRVGTKAFEAAQGHADVVLITDVSGSMRWRLDKDQTTGVNRDCDDPDLYDPDTRRMSLAKCLDKEFIDIILNNTENRVGLVAYSGLPNTIGTTDSTVIVSTHDLSNDTVSLSAEVGGYEPEGATGICGAIRRARLMLEEQSDPSRLRFIVVMTDGLANVQCKPPPDNTVGCIPYECPTESLCPGGGCVYQVAERLSDSKPAIAFMDRWIMVAGDSDGTFQGYEWQNNTWATNSSLASGLGDVGSDATPNIIFNLTGNNKWILISGESSGQFNGYYWDNAWVSNSSLVSGLGDVGYGSAPAVAFNITGDNRWILISGIGNGRFSGFYWNSGWVANTSLVSSLGDIGSYSTPAIAFNISGNNTWDLIVGQTAGTFSGYHWDNGWVSDSNVVNELGDAGGNSAPSIAFDLLPNNWYLITGLSNGRFYSYYWNTEKWLTICGDFVSRKASDDAIGDACTAGSASTIYSVGFGPVAYCSLAQATLESIALCGNGTYYASSDANELKNIYRGIAEGIFNLTFQAQTVAVKGANINILYPDSQIRINYTKDIKPSEYQEIAINIDTKKFSSCNGSFFVPEELRKIESVSVTSFSGDHWTHNISVNSSATSGWTSVYELTDYGSSYNELGDPYIVQIPEDLIKSNETNQVSVLLATSPKNVSANCSQDNIVIYTARFRASVFYSDIFPDMWGSNVTIYFDRDHDGVQDGSINVEVGQDLDSFDSELKTVDELDIDNNALDDAFVRLLDYLNFIEVPGNSGRSGSVNNPIDIELSEDMSIESLYIGGIPYMWGPVDISIGVWV